MALLRAWLPALLAAFLWLLSGALEVLSSRSTGRVGRVVDLLVAAETVPATYLTAPTPWGVVLPGLSALALAGAYAALLGLVRVRRRGAPVLTTVAAYWMCAVVAGVAAAALPVVPAVVQALTEPTVPMVLSDTQLLSAAHWGLVWGWVPAVVARQLDRDTERRSRLGPAASAALLYAAAAIALVVATPGTVEVDAAVFPAASGPPAAAEVVSPR